jgi:PAS domain S-box-containing protein
MAAPDDIPAADGAAEPPPERNAALLHAAVEAAGESVLITSPNLDEPGPTIEYANPAFLRMTGYTMEEVIGRTPRFLQGPRTDRAELDRMRLELAAHGTFRGDAINYRKDGTEYVIEWLVTAVRNGTGQVSHWVSVQRDITDRRRAEERQRFLLSELQHRVRNILAIVRSVVHRTVRTTDTVEDYMMHLDGRLNALARTQVLATRSPFVGIDLAFLVAEELLSYAAQEDEQVSIEGPDLRLQPRAAETLGLAIHELATNAVKYGALSNPAGHIRVSWRIEPEPRTDGSAHLLFEWTETGSQNVAAPPWRRGFGTELLERTLPFDLDAETVLTPAPDGLCWRIALPLTDRIVFSGQP